MRLIATPESGPDGIREYNHELENKWCKITMKFDILGNPQAKSTTVLLKTAKDDTNDMKSIKTRLGSRITYLQGILPFFESVKEVSSFNHVFRSH